MFRWLKRYSPLGLYGRAALIIALPSVALQVIVSVVFVQRHFEDVTRQMVDAHAHALSYLFAQVDAVGLEDARAAVGEPLALDIRVAEDAPVGTGRAWFDIAGLTVAARLAELYDLRGIELSDRRIVDAWIAHGGTLYEVSFDRRRVSARNPHQLLVLMVVVGGFMILVSYIFLRNQLRPIRRLSRAAEAFGRGRVEPYTPRGATEVRAAGSAFLDMRARIERQIEQRTLMLSGVSHDLRTPLTRMRLELSLMDPSEEVDALRADVEDMGRMIDAFLDFARVGAAEEVETVDLGAIIEDAVTDAERAGRSVELAGDVPALALPLRPMSVRRAIDNLISNAARYGTVARVSVALFERSVRIRVEDDGPGIPSADREAALRPFTRLDQSRNQNHGGSVGLGLAIAADTARRHGGTLRLGESEDLGGLCADIVIAL
ncbi:MAG: ATP-binding protein [Pseudomonadota bacterium]